MTVMAAVYEGGTLVEEKAIEEVLMKPGYDNVETGVVEVAQGQTVKVYLKDGQYTVPDTPDTPDAPGADGKKAAIGLPVILLIVAVVVSVAAVIIALVVTKPKKKAAAPKAEDTEEPKAEE